MNIMDKTPSGLILLTYKGKVLLMHKQKSVIDEEKHPWCLIGGVKTNKESFKEALSRKVEQEAGIKISNIEYIAEDYYHANLTDDNVNKIQRSEHQLLDFFTPRDLSKLLLTSSTQEFILKHGNLIL
jgi:NADH pyrophosphatase NudC (nudix superfamily)